MTTEEFLKDVCPNHTDKSKQNRSELLHILELHKEQIMNSVISFAEWVDWNKYERFEDRRDLWYDKKSSYSNQLPIKTTEDLWNEFEHYKFSK